MSYRYRDPFVERLHQDIANLIGGAASDADSIEPRLTELARENWAPITEYWRRTVSGLGVPDTAFKEHSPYFFPEQTPVRVFRTSGTTGAARGAAYYSPRGLELMDLSILANARRHIIGALLAPVILRLVPTAEAAPEMVMAHGMERIATTFGHPELSACVVGRNGVDFPLLEARLTAAVAERVPVILIGGSFAFVNVCDALRVRNRSWELPAGSKLIDAGGFKGRVRAITVEDLRAAAAQIFGIPSACCLNLFGMTELASQLYDAADLPLGPLGERPKQRERVVRPQVRDAQTLELRTEGTGLLEVVDLCVMDRPCMVLTGDRGIECAAGVAIAGRIERGQSRGCSLTLDALTKEPADA